MSRDEAAKYEAQDRAEVASLAAEGFTARQIARTSGISVRTVNRLLKETA